MFHSYPVHLLYYDPVYLQIVGFTWAIIAGNLARQLKLLVTIVLAQRMEERNMRVPSLKVDKRVRTTLDGRGCLSHLVPDAIHGTTSRY